MNIIHDKIIRAGLRPLQSCWSSHANYEAKSMFSGRTHYYDEETMRYFKCRVQSIRLSPNGVYAATICTQSGDWENTHREYRVVAHDLTGSCLERSDLGSLRTRRQADKVMKDLLARLNETEILDEAIKRETRMAEDALTALRSA